ncbi:periplasmic heavy metal sensor [Pseudorhodobacter ferrugineus]|uniref:periplasmic heavy metal sensor n=1 Tax=Pseudorhodobacter ferrugineus TaxID=77008 RepID=UPI0003B2E20D|nr:periplasmic heavy metal sensor [Pseudorhodobacter ferrugineus]
MSDANPISLRAPKPPFRWGRVVLFVSLALNLAVAGVVGGAVLGRFGPDRHDIAARDVGFGLFNDALSKEDRKALRRAYAQMNPDIRADRQKMRDDLQSVLVMLRADPFEVAPLRQALEAGAARITERQEQGQTVVLDYLATLSQAERAVVADRLEESLKRRARGPKRPRNDSDD